MIPAVTAMLGKWGELFRQVFHWGRSENKTRPMASSGATPAIWWGYKPVFVVALLGLLITIYFFLEVSDWEEQRVYTLFREASQDRILVVRREIEHTLATIRDIASYFEASPEVGRREFRKFVEPAIKRHAGIKALMWIPRVSHSDRESFVKEARRSFPPYLIKERNLSKEIVVASARDEYLPVLYVQPYQKNRELLGMDMALDTTIHTLLRRSEETGELRVSERVVLTDNGVEQSGFVVAMPVDYQELLEPDGGRIDAEAPGGTGIRGFAVGIFRIGDVVEPALETLSAGAVNIRFFEEVQAGQKVLLYTHISRMSGSSDLPVGSDGEDREWVHGQEISLGGRYWRVVCTPLAGRYEADTWSGWVVLAGGISFTALLTAYVATLVGRTKKVNRLVEVRTAELSSAMAKMNIEIRERKAAELELKTLNDDLEYWVAIRSSEAARRAQDLEQFAYVTSHDLKAPLRAISNLAEWIGEDLEDKIDDESREQLGLLRDRVRRMHALIEGLLEYSRVGRTEGSYTEVDTKELLLELIDTLSPPKGFVIKVPKVMPVFRTDRLLLGQVFANLISNSLKHHGGSRGCIEIGCNDRDGFYEFSVADDGMGIAPQYHEKIFMIFQTLEAKDYAGNTGIGLALVKKIVQERGGKIMLESAPGEGACFRFTWPKPA
ncbi:MAG: CHASE domain-containing protein [Gammaproteobacteria bacterium]|nr:CHASE domain-containing protein [Gammaproteobacteria bacterium]